MSLDHIRKRATEIASRSRQRSLRQTAAFVVVIVVSSWVIWQVSGTLQRVGLGVVMMAALAAVYRSYARRRAAMNLEEVTASTGRSFLMRLLVERREAARGALYWQVAPLAGGTAIFLIGVYLANPAHWQTSAGIWVLASVMTGIARWRLERTIAKYDKEIAALESP